MEEDLRFEESEEDTFAKNREEAVHRAEVCV